MWYALFFTLAAVSVPSVEGYLNAEDLRTSTSEPATLEYPMSVKNERVKSWLPTIRQVRTDLGLDEEAYPDAIVLSLIDVESDGDPFANRENSQFHGLLQMGRLAGIDVGFRDRKVLTTEHLLGDGYAAIEAFFKYQERYRSYHSYEPRNIALLWKGGPGTLETFLALERSDNPESAQDFLGTTLDGAPATYLARFREDLSFWESGESDQVVQQTPRAVVPGGQTGQGQNRDTRTISSVVRAPSGAFIRSSAVTAAPGCGTSPIGDPRSSRVFTPSSSSQSQSFVRALNPEETPIESSASAVLDYIGNNYLQNLDAFASTAHVRGLTSESRQWSPGKTRIVQGFIEDVATDEGVRFSFQTRLYNIATSYVKPLVNPVARNRWGQRRAYAPGDRLEDGNEIRDPETGEILYRHHLGVDYETRPSHGGIAVDQPCYAIADGVVRVAGVVPFYGYAIYVEHEGGVSSRYTHLGEIRVRTGDTVSAGQPIGLCGRTSTVNGQLSHDAVRIPHLHFELRINIGMVREGEMTEGILSNALNVSIDPDPLLALAPNPGEIIPEDNPEIVALRDAREAFLQYTMNADDPRVADQAADQYDMCTALLRNEQLCTMSRRELYEAQAASTAAQTRSSTVMTPVTRGSS